MLIPTLSRYDIPNINWAHAQISLEKVEWHQGATLLNIKHIHDKEELTYFLEQLYEYLEKKGINPKLPYPIYIQSDIDLISSQFIIVHKGYKNKFYLDKCSQAKGKENVILNKIMVFQKGIKNHSLFKIMNDFKNYSEKSKKLKNQCLENDFYQNIIKKWDEIT